MLKLVKKKSKKVDLALPYVSPMLERNEQDKNAEPVKITIIDYDEAQFQEHEALTPEECAEFKYKPTVTWIKVDGIHQHEIIEDLGRIFGIHPLIVEDIFSPQQRPKMEDFGDYIFIVLKVFYYNEDANELKAEQFSLIFSSNFVISFQESGGDVFKMVRSRIKNEKGRMRRMGADYLAYVLLDAIVDNYFLILERLGDKIESLEERMVSDPTQETLQEIYDLKSIMIFLRKSVWPLREVISRLERGDSHLVHESTGIYLRDVYDHTIQVIDNIEIFRDMVSEMLGIYLSSISNKMNEVMKILTIITTIFIPLTFISGIFSMNFKYMPELEWEYGYQYSLVLMASLGMAMVAYFWKKDWL